MVNRIDRFEGRDWLGAAMLFVVSFGLRAPFRSHYAYHWDSAQFALAMHHYDIGLSLPHRPGYFLYVMMGRLMNFLVGDPHASLVWVSVIAGAALVSLGYLLATAMFGRECGWASAIILATSPVCWFHSEIALTPIVDAALVTGTMLLCWRAIGHKGNWPWLVGMSAMAAVVTGVRQQTGPCLFPVFAYTLFRFPRPRWKKAILAALLFGLGCALWFIPMVYLSGGLGEYMYLLNTRVRLEAPTTALGGNLSVLKDSVCFTVASWWAGLLAAGILAAVEFSVSILHHTAEERRFVYAHYRDQFAFLFLWSVPLVALYLMIYMTMPGYILSYFPAVVILTGLGLSQLAHAITGIFSSPRQGPRWGYILVLGPVIILNCLMFVSPPAALRPLLLGLELTAPEIGSHDAELSAVFTRIRSQYRPEDVLICHDKIYFFWSFRHFQYHLPEYENCLLSRDRMLAAPYDTKLWYARGDQIQFLDQFDSRNRKVLLLIVPRGTSLENYAAYFDLHAAEALPDSGGCVYAVPFEAKR